MKVLITLLAVFATFSFVKAFNVVGQREKLSFRSEKDDDLGLNNKLIEMRDLLKRHENLALKEDIKEAIGFIQQVQSMNLVPAIDLVRSKRQATYDNCFQLMNDLSQNQIQVEIVQQNITNITTTLNTLNQKVVKFQLKVANSTGPTLTLNQNLLKTYISLVNSTTSKISSLKDQLNALQLKNTQSQSDIMKKCVTTERTISPTPEPSTTTTTPESTTTTVPETSLVIESPFGSPFSISFVGQYGFDVEAERLPAVCNVGMVAYLPDVLPPPLSCLSPYEIYACAYSEGRCDGHWFCGTPPCGWGCWCKAPYKRDNNGKCVISCPQIAIKDTDNSPL